MLATLWVKVGTRMKNPTSKNLWTRSTLATSEVIHLICTVRSVKLILFTGEFFPDLNILDGKAISHSLEGFSFAKDPFELDASHAMNATYQDDDDDDFGGGAGALMMPTMMRRWTSTAGLVVAKPMWKTSLSATRQSMMIMARGL